MSDENAQIAWAACLFEAEGTIVDSTGSVQLRVKMTDLDVLERLVDVFGWAKSTVPTNLDLAMGTYASRIGSGFALSRSSGRFSKRWRRG
jgi:hypothetical protein